MAQLRPLFSFNCYQRKCMYDITHVFRCSFQWEFVAYVFWRAPFLSRQRTKKVAHAGDADDDSDNSDFHSAFCYERNRKKFSGCVHLDLTSYYLDVLN